jgi:threonine dehydrogenase-like Zn-dependent dehydrogenase
MVEDGVADPAHGWNDSLQIMRVVPGDIPIEAAGLLCTWREVYAGMFTDFRLQPGDDIVVFGAGPVGLSFVKFGRLCGLGEIVCIDVLPNKRAKALEMGADAAFQPDDPALAERVASRGKGYDAVIDAVGREGIINTALSLVKMGGTVGVYGVLADSPITLDKPAGPLNFDLIFHQWPTRDAEAAAQEPLLELIRSGQLDWQDYVTGKLPVTEVAKAVEAVDLPTSIKTMLVMDDWG